jgi:NAD(P)-dependent dehydrogenase (short-subunit alcohol dehydrogenase family)
MTPAMDDGPAEMQWVIESTLLKERLGVAEEIADYCIFSSSTPAIWVQEQNLIADGGIVCVVTPT